MGWGLLLLLLLPTAGRADTVVIALPDGRELPVVGIIESETADEVCITTDIRRGLCPTRSTIVRIERDTDARNIEIRAAWKRAQQSRLRGQLGFVLVLNALVALAIVFIAGRDWSRPPPEKDSGQNPPGAGVESSKDGIRVWLAGATAACTMVLVASDMLPRQLPWNYANPLAMLLSYTSSGVAALFALGVVLATGVGYRLGQGSGRPHVGAGLALLLAIPVAVVSFIYYMMSQTF